MKQMTEKWWQRCLSDPEKLEHWLVSLYNNERDAEHRFKNFAELYCIGKPDEHRIMMEIADQESNHARLVESVIKSRGLHLYEKSSNDGRYWRNTLPCINDIKTAAAIGAYAEGLSLRRMRVIIADPNTPDDLRTLFSVIEPEEAYHAKALERIATKYGMKSVRDCHDKGLEELALKIQKR